MTIPPTRRELETMAGWAISARRGNCSPAQGVALGAFQDGCHELAQCIEELPAQRVEKTFHRDAALEGGAAERARHVRHAVPREVAAHIGVQQPDGECRHRFDIKTQKCLYCGRTYRDVKQRAPELMD